MKNEADDLERIKRHLDNLYEQGETCIHPDTKVIVTDPEYDLLVKRLAHLRPDSKELQKPSSADFDANAKKVKHNPPMTSISKAIGTLQERTETLDDWFENCDKGLHYIMAGKKDIRGKNYVQAFKWDGVACALYYENGKLVRAGLRPRDGINGEDVTENIKYVEGVPEKLPLNISCCIRGEIICKKSVFEKINSALKAKGEKTYANPRNYATGSIRQFKDPEITKERRLNFTAYSIVGLNNPPYKNEVERAKWCAKTLGIPYVQVRPYRDEDLEKMEKFAPKLDYEVDGIVISVSVLEDQEQLGTHGNSPNGNPKGKIAWKFSDEICFEYLALAQVTNLGSAR